MPTRIKHPRHQMQPNPVLGRKVLDGGAQLLNRWGFREHALNSIMLSRPASGYKQASPEIRCHGTWRSRASINRAPRDVWWMGSEIDKRTKCSKPQSPRKCN